MSRDPKCQSCGHRRSEHRDGERECLCGTPGFCKCKVFSRLIPQNARVKRGRFSNR